VIFAEKVDNAKKNSSYCKTELEHAVHLGKSIVVICDRYYKFQEKDIPTEWKKYTPLILGPRVIFYCSQFLSECTKILCNVKNFPTIARNKLRFYPKEYYLSIIQEELPPIVEIENNNNNALDNNVVIFITLLYY
jgi:hypothetical protein